MVRLLEVLFKNKTDRKAKKPLGFSGLALPVACFRDGVQLQDFQVHAPQPGRGYLFAELRLAKQWGLVNGLDQCVQVTWVAQKRTTASTDALEKGLTSPIASRIPKYS